MNVVYCNRQENADEHSQNEGMDEANAGEHGTLLRAYVSWSDWLRDMHSVVCRWMTGFGGLQQFGCLAVRAVVARDRLRLAVVRGIHETLVVVLHGFEVFG